jgi:hypothetical protein
LLPAAAAARAASAGKTINNFAAFAMTQRTALDGARRRAVVVIAPSNLHAVGDGGMSSSPKPEQMQFPNGLMGNRHQSRNPLETLWPFEAKKSAGT